MKSLIKNVMARFYYREEAYCPTDDEKATLEKIDRILYEADCGEFVASLRGD